jgi:transmembrane sensor
MQQAAAPQLGPPGLSCAFIGSEFGCSDRLNVQGVTMSERPHEIDEQAWNEAFDWVVALDRRAADPAVATKFRAWLAQADAHAEAYEQVRKVWVAAPRMRPSRTAKFVPIAPRLARRQWLVGAGAIAAGVALLLAVGTARDDILADRATATGEIKAVTLRDGTHVQLDTDTAIRVSFGAERRTVTLLRGRAFFDVVADPGRPFAVDAGAVRAEVLGTRFEMRRDAAAVTVSVEEGRLTVVANAFRREGLTRGEAVRIDVATGVSRPMAAAPDSVAAWRHGQLVVEDWTVAEVLAELGRYHRGAILLRDERLGVRRVSGFYDVRRPTDAVRSVVHAHGGWVREYGPWIFLVSGR